MFRQWRSGFSACAAVLVLALVAGCGQKDLAGEYAQDRLDCQNLMSLHAWYHSAFMNDVELQTIWAQKADDVVFAQNSGFWKGMDKIKAYYGAPIKDKSQVAGHFQMHNITTGVIVVAEDRKTAKGIFYTPGMVGAYNQGVWMWERYGADFIREDGVWKIWHLHVYSDFAASFGKDLGAGGPGGPGGPPPGGGAAAGGKQTKGGAGNMKAERFGAESLNKGGAPGGPGGAPGQGSGRQVAPGVWLSAEAMTPSYTAKEGYKELGQDTIPLLLPTPPVPYKTFSETFSYADPDEYAKALAAVKKP